jgi:hypothetical protein
MRVQSHAHAQGYNVISAHDQPRPGCLSQGSTTERTESTSDTTNDDPLHVHDHAVSTSTHPETSTAPTSRRNFSACLASPNVSDLGDHRYLLVPAQRARISERVRHCGVRPTVRESLVLRRLDAPPSLRRIYTDFTELSNGEERATSPSLTMEKKEQLRRA